MCGIAGWVDFDHDARQERDTALAMTRAMALRGPDDEGLWVDQHVALGHRRLAVIDVARGGQPMTAAPDNIGSVLVYSGEVYNFRELRADLAACGQRFRTDSDTEVVLHGYERWGRHSMSNFIRRLNGMYAFAVWDPRTEELYLVRDRLGIKPLFYYPLASGLLFGSEPKAILANPRAAAVIDIEGLLAIVSRVRRPGQAPFRGLREVRPGHYLQVGRDGVEEHRYWGFEARPHVDDVRTTVTRVRELLEDIVTRQLISEVPRCILLSGGLDSSSITALAQWALDQQGNSERVRSFAVDFAGYTENFTADIARDTPDRPFVHAVAEHVRCDHRDITLSAAELTDPGLRAAVVRAWDLPYNRGDTDTSLYLLCEAVRRHSTVALSGEAADELFAGYRWFFDPAAIRAETFPWMVTTALGAPDALLRPNLAKCLEDYVADAYRDALVEVPHLPGEDPSEYRMRQISYLHLTRFLPQLLDRKDRMSMAHGLEVRVPFCDHRLIEYVFNVTWKLKTFDGREKSLLRAATRDLLPVSVVQRRKSPYPATQDAAYDQQLRNQLGQLLADSDAPALALLDLTAAQSAAQGPLPGVEPRIERVLLEGAVRLNTWLQMYGVDLVGV